ncbi:hypothetical protein ACFV11_16945 [Streptomyces globisporus]|uniref:hypothetical protein n=1 Tax=Streptomyces globisporus TaxID=1908 RepID=UPI0036965E9F
MTHGRGGVSDGRVGLHQLPLLKVLGAVSQHLLRGDTESAALPPCHPAQPDPPDRSGVQREDAQIARSGEGVGQGVAGNRCGVDHDLVRIDRVDEAGGAGEDGGPDRTVGVGRPEEQHALLPQERGEPRPDGVVEHGRPPARVPFTRPSLNGLFALVVRRSDHFGLLVREGAAVAGGAGRA